MTETYNLSGLGYDDVEPKMVKVVLGSAKQGQGATHVQHAPVDANQVGYDQVAAADPEWEEYQRWKVWKQQQGGATDVAVSQSNAPVGLKKTIAIVCDESPDMPPTGYTVGLNGTCYIIRPGAVVNVPEGVLEVIRHAIQSVPIVDNLSQRVVGYRDRPRIPWRYATA